MSRPANADVRRLIDANANRAGEAMRVLEDAARFVRNDAKLAEAFKTLRHDFGESIRQLPGPPISAMRNTAGDVGTAITMDTETQRRHVSDVVAAAGKRLAQALRCCEEYGKLIDPRFAATIEKLRYRSYDLEAELINRMTLPDPATWRVCVLISESLCTHHDWLDVARAAIEGGAQCIQLREKQLADGELLERAAKLVEATQSRSRKRPVAVMVNDRPDIATLAGAHGVHLGTGDLPIDLVRRQFGRSLLIGASTHHLREASAAIRAGADYCGVGAMFETSTKKRKPSGPAYLSRYLKQHAPTPHLAIGGVSPDNIAELVKLGCRAVAVSSCVCSAKNPATVVRKLRRGLES